MYSRNISSPLFPQNEINKDVEPEEKPLECPGPGPDETGEPQQVNLGELGNYFDVVRNNYFEANRVIFIVGPITWEIGIHVIQKLAFYDDDSKRPVTIYISSPGGECDAGFAIIDCINELKRKEIEINTICFGSCSSMASVILASGTIGHRYAFPSSRIMIHQAGIEATGGKLNDINIIQHELQVWTDNMNKIFKKQTGKDLDELKALTSYDNYMSAAEAKKLGLIDKVKTKLI
jgi:ATP-dependent Clp protease protease subunit